MRFRKAFSAVALIMALMTAVACSKSTDRTASSEKKPEAAPADTGAGAGPVSAHDAPAPTSAAILPEGHPPIGEGAGSAAAGTPVSLGTESAPAEVSELSWTSPSSWKEESPSSAMRKAQYRIPAVKGDHEDAECSVFYFGPKQGGSAEANAKRWVDQFTQPDGSSSERRSKIAVRSINGNQVMFVEVRGIYNPMTMPGGPTGSPKPGYAMIGAIVSAGDAPWFFKMTGPEKTIEANKDELESLITSIHPKS